MDVRRIPVYPPPPPSEPQPPPGTDAWVKWHLRNSFQPDDAAIIEYVRIVGTVPHVSHHKALMAYVDACHIRRWAGWQATLAWALVEHSLAQHEDDDIPF